MRMQKEEKIVVVLLLMALGSLAAAFWAFSPEESNNAASGLATQESSLSSLITLEGRITGAENTRSGGNLIIKLDSAQMPVFIPASAGAKELSARLKTGERVRVTGTINSYQGKDELKVSRRADVQMLEG